MLYRVDTGRTSGDQKSGITQAESDIKGDQEHSDEQTYAQNDSDLTDIKSISHNIDASPDPPTAPILSLFNKLSAILSNINTHSAPTSHSRNPSTSSHLSVHYSTAPSPASIQMAATLRAGSTGLASFAEKSGGGGGGGRGINNMNSIGRSGMGRHRSKAEPLDTFVYMEGENVRVQGDDMDVGGVVLGELKDVLER